MPLKTLSPSSKLPCINPPSTLTGAGCWAKENVVVTRMNNRRKHFSLIKSLL
jgi:hypothetical protein